MNEGSRACAVAVIDLGSARFKLTVAQLQGSRLLFATTKAEVGLSGLIGQGRSISPEGITKALVACEHFVSESKSRGVSTVVAVATEAIRRASNCNDLLALLRPLLGQVTILAPSEEAQLYYAGVWRQLKAYDLCNDQSWIALDAGGGSTQIVWGMAPSSSASIPTGTFTLEAQFQPNKMLPTRAILEAMSLYINNKVSRAVPPDVRVGTVVLGSSCMADFVSSALVRLKTPPRLRTSPLEAPLAECSTRALAALYEALACKPYEALGEFYPGNPYFMFGADKALLNVLAVAERVGAERILATNESLSTSVARMVLFDDRISQPLLRLAPHHLA